MRVAGRWLVAASAVVAVMASIAMARRISQANAQSDAARALALALAELQSAARQSALCSARNPVGAGLRAEYFARDRWNGPPLMTRTERLNDLVTTQPEDHCARKVLHVAATSLGASTIGT